LATASAWRSAIEAWFGWQRLQARRPAASAAAASAKKRTLALSGRREGQDGRH
jgi:hypothetical protein